MSESDKFKQGLSVGLLAISVLALCKAIQNATPMTLDALKDEAKRAAELIDKLIGEFCD